MKKLLAFLGTAILLMISVCSFGQVSRAQYLLDVDATIYTNGTHKITAVADNALRKELAASVLFIGDSATSYVTPYDLATHTVTVPFGGTGKNSFTAYSVICGGTTSTGALQNVSGLGSSGQVLTSAGAGALPTWTTIQSTTITAGSGITVSGSVPSYTVTNAAPNQTVTLTGAGTTTVSGTYPTYTVSSNAEVPLTFSTGLTRTTNTITANLSTGVSGGQSVIGGTAASESLTLSSTANATKGYVLFGSSGYSESNNRLGIQNQAPQGVLDVTDNSELGTWITSTGVARLNLKRTTADGISAGSLRYLSSDNTVKWSISTSLVTGADNLEFNRGALGNAMLIERTTGNVIIGAGAPSATLHVIGKGATNATVTYLGENSSGADGMILKDDGSVFIPSSHNNANLPSGIIGMVASGTYTFTATDSANTSANTTYEAQYMRVGNVVTVSGVIDVDPTITLTITILKFPPPIPSNFTATSDCRGTTSAEAIAGQSGAILCSTAYAAADYVLMKWNATDVTNQPMSYTYTYEVK